MVVTVFGRDEKVERKDAWMDDSSCVRCQYNNVTIWIKAYVWSGEDYRRRTDKKVSIVCPVLGFALRNIRRADFI